jgi:hypothetical protein
MIEIFFNLDILLGEPAGYARLVKKGESGKPDSVLGNHSSRRYVAIPLKRSLALGGA